MHDVLLREFGERLWHLASERPAAVHFDCVDSQQGKQTVRGTVQDCRRTWSPAVLKKSSACSPNWQRESSWRAVYSKGKAV
jgi:hypothetical protein